MREWPCSALILLYENGFFQHCSHHIIRNDSQQFEICIEAFDKRHKKHLKHSGDGIASTCEKKV